MADATSTIRVNIVGDAKGLQTELGKAQGGVSGLSSSMKALGGALALGGAAAVVLDFGQTALEEADRLGDATGRVESHLGDLSASLIEHADDYAVLGQSTQDILELEASFLDYANALGLSDDRMAELAPKIAETAAAMALITDMDPATVVDLLGKAAGGSERALKTLGVDLDEAAVQARALQDSGKDTPDMLTESELAAARYAEILEELAPRLVDVTTGTGDFEQKGAELEARMETLSGKIGETVEGPLTDFLGGTLLVIDMLPQMIHFLGVAAEGVGGFMSIVFGAVDAVNALIDALGDLIGAQNDARRNGSLRGGGGSIVPGISDSSQGYGTSGTNVSVYVNPFDAADVEKQTVAALNAYYQRNGSQTL
jgi:hypothetical protein